MECAGLTLVGWYHSHPTFRPDPSVRDIETQRKFQDWFSQGGNHFVGLIISPYNSRGLTAALVSQVQCLTISDLVCEDIKSNIPYRFSFEVELEACVDSIFPAAIQLSQDYSSYFNRVRLNSLYGGVSCLQKVKSFMMCLYFPYSLGGR